MRFVLLSSVLSIIILSGFSFENPVDVVDANEYFSLNIGPCDHLSTVRPNGHSQSPRERCEAECAAGNCPDGSNQNPGNGSPITSPPPKCSDCFECHMSLTLAAGSTNFGGIGHNEQQLYESCLQSLRMICGSPPFSNCYVKTYFSVRIKWQILPIPLPIPTVYRSASCRSK